MAAEKTEEKSPKKDSRAEKRAAALRQNLRKRKALQATQAQNKDNDTKQDDT